MQLNCEQALHKLIEKGSETVKIVLMKPFDLAVTAEYKRSPLAKRGADGGRDKAGSPAPDADRSQPGHTGRDDQNQRYRAEKESWMARSKARFGEAEIPVEFGLALRSNMGPSSLVSAAGAAWDELMHPGAASPPPCEGDGCAAQRENSATTHCHPEGEELKFVDPRVFRGRGGVQVVSLAELAEEDGWRFLGGSIVFVGAAYGSEEDTFLTPVGEVYGVEFHAAALLSKMQPLSHGFVGALLGDLFFAFAFSLATVWCVHHWREARGDGRETAGLWGLLLVVVVMGLLLLVSRVSWSLLQHCGVWSSPVPIMLGILIDSVTGRWTERPDMEDESPSGQGAVRRLVGRVFQFLFWDIVRLLAQGHWGAATCVALRRAVWLFVIVFAVALALCDVWPPSYLIARWFGALAQRAWSALQPVLLFLFHQLGVA